MTPSGRTSVFPTPSLLSLSWGRFRVIRFQLHLHSGDSIVVVSDFIVLIVVVIGFVEPVVIDCSVVYKGSSQWY